METPPPAPAPGSPSDSTTPPKPAAPRPKRPRSVQNQAIAAYITDSQATLNAALGTPEIATLLAAHGYPAAELERGLALQAAAQAAFGHRLPGIAADRQATADLHGKITPAREDYVAFRGIARAAFPRQSDRIALGVTGDIPDDFGRFVTAAKTSYAAAKSAPYTAKLTTRGYPPAKLATFIAALDALTEPPDAAPDDDGDTLTPAQPSGRDAKAAKGAKSQSRAAAAATTPPHQPPPAGSDDDEVPPSDLQALQAAYDALRAYMKEFKGVARVVLRKRHDLLREMKI